ncbi:hypothetical protein ACFSFY_00535 [Sporosarcina siberiensis]|uniref:YceG-like family protein n=1 Tax=Sporosarcina siberiensis TaxID=1365606 RepID=A0ABW4SCG2_9BACL
MIRDILRTIGVACILTGTFLFFENTGKEPINNDASQQDLQIKDLEDKLSATQNELSKLQTATSVSQKSKTEKSEDENKIVEKESESETEIIIKTLFTIQPGTDSTSVGYELLRQGLIKDNIDFETYLTTENLSGKIQIGEYELDSSMDIKTIVELITK